MDELIIKIKSIEYYILMFYSAIANNDFSNIEDLKQLITMEDALIREFVINATDEMIDEVNNYSGLYYTLRASYDTELDADQLISARFSNHVSFYFSETNIDEENEIENFPELYFDLDDENEEDYSFKRILAEQVFEGCLLNNIAYNACDKGLKDFAYNIAYIDAYVERNLVTPHFNFCFDVIDDIPDMLDLYREYEDFLNDYYIKVSLLCNITADLVQDKFGNVYNNFDISGVIDSILNSLDSGDIHYIIDTLAYDYEDLDKELLASCCDYLDGYVKKYE